MSKLLAERLTATGMIVIAGFFVIQAKQLPSASAAFPVFTEYAVILLALIMLLRSFLTHDKKFSGNVRFDFSYVAMKPIYVMVVAVIYALATFRIGFYVSSIIFYFLVIYMTGLRNHKAIGVTALVLFPLLYLFFNVGLDADLPEGFLI